MPTMGTSEMAWGVLAEFPLGKYVGHRGTGITDEYPSPSRVHAALLNAAAQGIRAELVDEHLQPSPHDLTLLQWLEANPPTFALIPATAGARSDPRAYRDMGLLNPGKNGTKKDSKAAVRGVAMAGPIGWAWSTVPPPAIVDSLTDLCPEVPYLGTSESPVLLRVGEFEPTHQVDPTADVYTAGGVDVEIPLPGRTKTLTDGHAATRTAPPTTAQDKAKANEKDGPSPRTMTSVATAKYRPIGRSSDEGQLPWHMAVLLEIEGDTDLGIADDHTGEFAKPISDDEKVSWCVALHRALISVIGDGAPPLITGAYVGRTRPPNRLGIQVVDKSPLMAHPISAAQAFVLLIPPEAAADDLSQIQIALASLSRLRGPKGRQVTFTAPPRAVAAVDFWTPPGHGLTRIWATVPAAVPDTRPLMKGKWSLHDAVAVSVGLVWKSQLSGPEHAKPSRADVPRGDVKYVALADGALACGVQVLSVNRVTRGDVTRFIHRVSPGTVVQPYVATLTLGSLASDRSIVAIGQSRHLGGGLLCPLDVPRAVAVAMGQR